MPVNYLPVHFGVGCLIYDSPMSRADDIYERFFLLKNSRQLTGHDVENTVVCFFNPFYKTINLYMKNEICEEQVNSYRLNGFIVIEDFLSAAELEEWRIALTKAVINRRGDKLPGRKEVYGKGDNTDKSYFDNVFDQLLNLWQDNEKMRKIMLDKRLGKMAATLAGVDGIRIWHDQALIKKPWANPTSWHLDTPYWSFSDRKALSVWVALDDATLENGCLFFIPSSYKRTSFENPGIGKNMGAIFDVYPEFKSTQSFPAFMKAGSCSFHNGLTIHGAHANMTPGYRRAMTCAYMPDGNTFNGTQNILSDEQIARLEIGDLLNDELQNPLIYSNQLQPQV